MRKILVFLFAVVFAPITAIRAEEDVVKAKEVVVTATKTEAELEDVPATVVVITKEEIKARGAERISDIIRFDESVNLQSYAGRRDVPSIRGFKSEHVLILIDGKRLSGEDTKDNELNRITLENVERIEIVRGPASALYGTEALGGVINIITKTPQRFSLEFRPEYGFFEDGNGGQKNTNAYVSGLIGNLGLSLSGTFLDSSPYYRKDLTTWQGDEEKKTISFKADYHLTGFTRLTFDTSYLKEYIETRSISNNVLYKNIDNNKRYDLSLGLTHKSPDLEYLLRGYTSIYYKDYEYRTLSTNALGQFTAAERRTPVAEGRVTKEVFKNHLLTLGGEYRPEFFKGNRIQTGKGAYTETREGITEQGSEAEINYLAGYLQDEWQASDNLLIIPSIRYDDSDKFESNLSPKIGFTFKILPEIRVKASYGQGFKSPSPRELYYEFRHTRARYMVVGNPDIKSEISNSYEASLEGEKGGFSGKLTYFYNDIKDLIEAVEGVPAPAGTPSGWRYFIYRNISKANTQGVEALISLSITDELFLKGSYAYLDAMDKTNNKRLIQRPRHKAIPKLVYDNKGIGLRANVWGEYIGDNLWQASSGTTPEKVKDYSLWYLNVAKDIGKHLELYGGVDNIFGKKDDDIPIIGAFYYGGLRARF